MKYLNKNLKYPYAAINANMSIVPVNDMQNLHTSHNAFKIRF